MIRSSLTDHGTQTTRRHSRRPRLAGPARGDPDATHPGTAGLGAIVAVVICVVIAAVGWVVAPPMGWIVGAIGFPGRPCSRWMSSRAVAATRHGAVGVAAKLAVGSILIADALVVGIVPAGAAWIDQPRR